MLPFTSFGNFYTPLTQYQVQMCPQYDFNNVYMSFSNYGYYSEQNQYSLQNCSY